MTERGQENAAPRQSVQAQGVIRSQSVTSGLSRSAIFLVLTIEGQSENARAVHALCPDLGGLVRSVGFRDPDGELSCIMGIGAKAWGNLFECLPPRELHEFREIEGVHRAVSTPGDILFHIRAASMDLCFELATQITMRLGNAVKVVDEAHGFKNFDERDLLGFVDGTENPVDQEREDAVLVGEEDSAFEGSSYVIIQKYLHDLVKWSAIPVERQEAIIGRKKLSDVELPDAEKQSFAHNVLTSIEKDGRQLAILRDNMPFGEIGKGEFGTYFIGYARSPERIETMLENMFIGNPPGNYDRLLDVSKAVTGSLFFVPSSTFLDNPPAFPGENSGSASNSDPSMALDDGSLGIGNLKDET